jgi:DNA-binding IclR family transcriptional regulator
LEICFDILTKGAIPFKLIRMSDASSRDLADLPRSHPDRADPSFATTLAHGLDVLAAFRNADGSLSNGDLAAATGLSRPTVSRLTYTLTQLGYLRRDTKGRFQLGLAMLAATYPLLATIKVRQMARPLMRDFATYAGGTVSIAMPLGLDFIYVETTRTTDTASHLPDVGFSSTLAPTAVGRALLSLFTPEELAAYVAKVKAERPEEAGYVERQTMADVALCRERGFAISLGEWRREIFGVAAPLYRTATGDCLAVNCGIPSFRFSAEQVERDCGPRILGLARSIRALVAGEEVIFPA